MQRAVIGITTNYGKNVDALPTVYLLRAYVQAVQNVGGVPVLLPSDLSADGWQAIYERLDGILFSGGGDISPEQFAGQPHPRVYDVEPERDALELALVRAAVRDGKPFLGICRGCQLINVALGGTLYTHLPDQFPGALDHAYPGSMRTVLVHSVHLKEDSRLAKLLGEPMVQVNSLHHQGLKDVAAPLRAVAYAPDGLVEAVELPDHPFGLAVQWHPEWLSDQAGMVNLFARFVESCLAKPVSVIA